MTWRGARRGWLTERAYARGRSSAALSAPTLPVHVAGFFEVQGQREAFAIGQQAAVFEASSIT
jgi:hypothetical protein